MSSDIAYLLIMSSNTSLFLFTLTAKILRMQTEQVAIRRNYNRALFERLSANFYGLN